MTCCGVLTLAALSSALSQVPRLEERLSALLYMRSFEPGVKQVGKGNVSRGSHGSAKGRRRAEGIHTKPTHSLSLSPSLTSQSLIGLISCSTSSLSLPSFSPCVQVEGLVAMVAQPAQLLVGSRDFALLLRVVLEVGNHMNSGTAR